MYVNTANVSEIGLWCKHDTGWPRLVWF